MGTDLPPRQGDALQSIFMDSAQLIEECEELNVKEFTFFMKTEGGFRVNNPIALKKAILKQVTDQSKIISLRKTRADQIIVTAQNKSTALEILKIDKINVGTNNSSQNKEIKVESRLCLDNLLGNYIIRGIDQEITLQEIQTEIENQGIKIYSLTRFAKATEEITKEGKKVVLNPLKTVKFQTPTLNSNMPKKVHIALEIHYVNQYYEKIRICKFCWRFGHGQGTCRSKRRCSRCGQEHPVEDCKETYTKCLNCGEGHEVDSEECPMRKEEEAILQEKNRERIPYTIAKEKIKKSIAHNIKEKKREETQQTNIIRDIVKEILEPVMNQLITIQQNQTWIINTLLQCDIIHAETEHDPENDRKEKGEIEDPTEIEETEMDFNVEKIKRHREEYFKEQFLKKQKKLTPLLSRAKTKDKNNSHHVP